MKPRSWIRLVVAATCLLAAPAFANESQEQFKRYALVIGSNSGGPERVSLKYAEEDAKEIIRLLNRIGGVQPEDCKLLIHPDREQLMASIGQLQETIRQAKLSEQKTEFILYYSGHSDEEALLLDRTQVHYAELKKTMAGIPADVRIAILDSCSSGALTRVKGGTSRPPFLLDTSYDMKGYAFMTSSAMNEASQESDKLQGSFFTHALISGLRGAADTNQDGKITLSEAYQFAYNETLARTEKTLSGPQHPNYDIQMTGTGDVVMTDIRRSSSLLNLDAKLTGRLFIRDHRGQLVMELRKTGGRPIQLGLEAGDYTLTRETNNRLYTANVGLKSGQQVVLAESGFIETQREATRARGAATLEEDADEEGAQVEVQLPAEGYQRIPWTFQWSPEPSNQKVIHEHLFYILGGDSEYLDGWSLGLGLGQVRDSMCGFQISLLGNTIANHLQGGQIAGFFNTVGGSMSGIQALGFYNYVKNDLKGVQVSGGLNVVEGRCSGIQASIISNYTGQDAEGVAGAGIYNFSGKSIKGIQASGVFNYAGSRMEGAQATGVFNYCGGDSKGMQGSGVFNYRQGKSEGMQAAGAFNYCGEDSEGMQASGVCNYRRGKSVGLQATGVFNYCGGGSQGMQTSGVCNYAGGESTMAQISLVNISQNGKKLQLGVLNIADHQEGESLGLVSLARNGKISLMAWGDNLTGFNTAVKFRVNHLYSSIGLGKKEWQAATANHVAGHFRVGGYIPWGSVYLEPDLGLVLMHAENDRSDCFIDRQTFQARLTAGVQIIENLAVFIGAGVNYGHTLTADTLFSQGEYSPLYLGGAQVTF